jgi:hypothetical protein
MHESGRVDLDVLVATRRCLHGVAELLLAGPEHRATGRIRLHVAPAGFSTLPLPGTPSRISVSGTELVVDAEGKTRRIALTGTYRAVGSAAGIEAGAPVGVYHDGSGVAVGDEIRLDPAATEVLEAALATGDEALRRLATAHDRSGEDAVPVLWPEHFDVGLSFDEVNFGLSPGDSGIAEPYAYVGPWKQRVGDFWDQPFGSARRLSELGDADAVLGYFETGWTRAQEDPLA